MRVVLDEGAYIPERAHEADAGADLRTPYRVIVYPKSSVTVDTGVHVEIPAGYVGLLKSKSGLNVKCDLTGEGVIDSGYTGSIVCKLYNHGEYMHIFERGDKIIQLVIVQISTPKFEQVESLENTDRGNNGFGSTGK